MPTCAQCSMEVSRDGFTSNQYRKGPAARCKQCISSVDANAAAPDLSVSDQPVGSILPLSVGTTVIISGLVSRADLNGCHGVVTGADAERYAVSVQGSATVRIKPSNVTAVLKEVIKDEDGGRSTVDPRRLAPWPGLSCGRWVLMPEDGAGEPFFGPLHFCFQQAIPIGLKLALTGESPAQREARARRQLDEHGADLTPQLRNKMLAMMIGDPERAPSPWAQFVHSLAYVALDYEREREAFRFVLQEDHRKDPTRARSPAIVIDVLQPALACPAHVAEHQTS